LRKNCYWLICETIFRFLLAFAEGEPNQSSSGFNFLNSSDVSTTNESTSEPSGSGFLFISPSSAIEEQVFLLLFNYLFILTRIIMQHTTKVHHAEPRDLLSEPTTITSHDVKLSKTASTKIVSFIIDFLKIIFVLV
jgi:hypothetical protein